MSALALVLALSLASPDAGTDDVVLKYSTPVTVEGRLLPPGYYFPEKQFDKMNAEVRRLQVVEAEHKNETSFATALIVGLILGVAAGAGVAIAATAR